MRNGRFAKLIGYATTNNVCRNRSGSIRGCIISQLAVGVVSPALEVTIAQLRACMPISGDNINRGAYSRDCYER
jgi:hypothetical protein